MEDMPYRLQKPVDLDETDRKLIRLVAENGRLSNRALAGEVGLTEATIAARLRSLSERNVLGFTASLDWRAAGYHWDAWLEVTVQGRSTREVGQELAAVEGVQAVAAVFANYDLLVHVILPTQDDAVDFVDRQIARVAGVQRVRTNVALETVKATTRFARIPIIPGPLHFPNPVVELDDLDKALIEKLIIDGRQSNREVARKLDVSETTVRSRLRRLESSGLLRITARSSALLTGELGAWGFIGVDVAGGSVREIAMRMAAMPDTVVVAITAGTHDILAFVIARSRSRLLDLADTIRNLPHVEAAPTSEGIEDYGIEVWWSRLVDA